MLLKLRLRVGEVEATVPSGDALSHLGHWAVRGSLPAFIGRRFERDMIVGSLLHLVGTTYMSELASYKRGARDRLSSWPRRET